MARNRLKGKQIVFSVEGVSYVEDATSIVLTHEEADDDEVTFADAAAGGAYEWKMAITAIQATDAVSLHTFFWAHAGEEVDFIFAPHGNAVASATQPHYLGTIQLSKKLPDVGGDADSTWTFEMELDVVGALTKKVTA